MVNDKGFKKVFFVIPTLGVGGTERVILNILRYMDRSKFEPHLVLFERKGDLLTDLPFDIDVKELAGIRSRYGLKYFLFVELAKLLRKEKPDVVVSFMWYPNLVTVLANFLSGIHCNVIISERTSIHTNEGLLNKWLRSFSIRFLYGKALKIIVNSEGIARELNQKYRISAGRFAVISNPLDIRRISELSGENFFHPWYEENVPIVISVGRFVKEKGFEYLIRALNTVISDGMQCRLVMVGEGPEEGSLKGLTRSLHIEENIAFLGYQKNPYKYLARSTLFVLSSVNEGFPNVLLEAMALGVPSIATRCQTGPEEIVTDGVNGFLVQPANGSALADSIKRLLLDDDLRKRLGSAARKRAEDFAVEKIVKQYEDVIGSAC